jgi:hypothetical protein
MSAPMAHNSLTVFHGENTPRFIKRKISERQAFGRAVKNKLSQALLISFQQTHVDMLKNIDIGVSVPSPVAAGKDETPVH